jgi:hypothetical protein
MHSQLYLAEREESWHRKKLNVKIARKELKRRKNWESAYRTTCGRPI